LTVDIIDVATIRLDIEIFHGELLGFGFPHFAFNKLDI
jgi:hypothetical protein